MKNKNQKKTGFDKLANRSKIKVSAKAGMPPGSLHYVGQDRMHEPGISVMDYSETECNENDQVKLRDCLSFKDSENISWIHIDGVHDLNLIDEIGRHYGIHSLLLEDIVNTEQRPKLEEFDGLLFFTIKNLKYQRDSKVLETEQLSIVLGDKFLISFSEKQDSIFEPVKDRIRNGKNSLRDNGADYLLYELLDVVVDNYFRIIEDIGDVMEDLEEVLLDPNKVSLQLIQNNKKDLLTLRKSIYPLRELMYKLHNEENKLITTYTARYFGDIYDHTLRIVETLENYRDLNQGLKDIYLSSISLKMNQIMKVLTIISTIFIPLTFIVGIYGMNFKMPELKWHYGYAFVWGVMILISLLLIAIFKKKKWF